MTIVHHHTLGLTSINSQMTLGLPGWDCNHRSLFGRYVDSSQTLLGCTYMMFCDLQYVEGSLAVVGKLVYADWLLVFCSFFV